MKMIKILLTLLIMTFLCSAKESSQPISNEFDKISKSNSDYHKEKCLDILSYLPFLNDGYTKYLAKNKEEAFIMCRKCLIKRFTMIEFGSFLVIYSINNLILGKINFNKVKALLDGYKEALNSIDSEKVVCYMTYISDEIKSFCSDCLLSSQPGDEDTAWIRMSQAPF